MDKTNIVHKRNKAGKKKELNIIQKKVIDKF